MKNDLKTSESESRSVLGPATGAQSQRQIRTKALREAGYSYAGIALELGISRERVRQILNGGEETGTSKQRGRQEVVLLRTADVARLLGIHANTVRRWANDGSLKAYRVGKRGDRRFRREDVESALSSHLFGRA